MTTSTNVSRDRRQAPVKADFAVRQAEDRWANDGGMVPGDRRWTLSETALSTEGGVRP
jgi:hypothetical protein